MERRDLNPWKWQDDLDFNHAIEITAPEKIVFCAGQIASDDDGGPTFPGDMEGQYNKALDNLERVLAQADMKLSDVVRLTLYVTDVEAFHEAAQKVSPRLRAAGLKPTSTLLKVAGLADPAFLIEIEATAAK